MPLAKVGCALNRGLYIYIYIHGNRYISHHLLINFPAVPSVSISDRSKYVRLFFAAELGH